ncbi:hypothetical protein AYM40_19960 [Paraburkholderia phytofirmans OLGA172]|uniref:Uncharacterized protein n=1 Tax=Paraburkholderia phytofirmans OLGA172 TaxID=1417228 RepID=A0A167W653_9BURK|nr:hypothetical protein AYM40_19960 [Paraburkholderia phytofirmans OLGA172]
MQIFDNRREDRIERSRIANKTFIEKIRPVFISAASQLRCAIARGIDAGGYVIFFSLINQEIGKFGWIFT